MKFGPLIRRAREELKKGDRRYSVRQLAMRIGVEPAYLSKIERGEVRPPSERKILLLARELDKDPDALLALAGKVASDVQDVIRKRPRIVAGLLRRIGDAPEKDLRALVGRYVEEGKKNRRKGRQP